MFRLRGERFTDHLVVEHDSLEEWCGAVICFGQKNPVRVSKGI